MRWLLKSSNARASLPAAIMLTAVGLWLVGGAESQPLPRMNPAGVLSVLKVRQPVAVKESGGRFELSILPDAELLGHEVVEVGVDYVVVRDVNSIAETRIPIYSIKSITAMQRMR